MRHDLRTRCCHTCQAFGSCGLLCSNTILSERLQLPKWSHFRFLPFIYVKVLLLSLCKLFWDIKFKSFRLILAPLSGASAKLQVWNASILGLYPHQPLGRNRKNINGFLIHVLDELPEAIVRTYREVRVLRLFLAHDICLSNYNLLIIQLRKKN